MRFAVCLLAVVSCAEPDLADGIVQVATRADSAGIEVVTLPVEVVEAVPRYRLADSAAVVIGVLDGDEPYVLDVVRGAVRFPSGTIAILDERARALRLYDRDGRYLRRLASGGEGPGELGGRGGLRLGLVSDTLYVVNHSARANAAFIEEGFAGRTDRLGSPTYPTSRSPSDADDPLIRAEYLGVLGGGTVVYSSQPIPLNTVPGARTPVDRELMVPDLVWRAGGDSLELMVQGAPMRGFETGGRDGPGFGVGIRHLEAFSHRAYHSIAAGRLVSAHSHELGFRFLDSLGRTELLVRVAMPRRAVTPGEIDAVRDSVRALGQALDAELRARAAVNLTFGTHHPFVAGVRGGRDGSVWVRLPEDRGVSMGDLPSAFRYHEVEGERTRAALDVETSVSIWLVFDSAGRPVAHVELPEPAEVLEWDFGEGLVYRMRDDYGVQRVEIRRLESVPPG